MGGDIILEVENLRKEFGDTVAVEDLSFHLRRGEILGLLGVNGAGKSTTMNMLLSLTEPTSGSIRIFSMPMPKERIAILQRCNFSSAYAALPSNLLVHQNLRIFGMIYRVRNLEARITELLELFEISHLRNRVAGRLSSGEGTRMNLCKALLNAPELLMLDEPTASLDPDIADKVRKALRRVQKETNVGILYTSHNMRDIEEVCDRVLFIHEGRVVAEGTPAQIVRDSHHGSLEELFIELARSGKKEANR